MSRLAASFGAALLPEECGGPAPDQLVGRVERYLARLPTTPRLAMRAGLVSLAAASYLTAGRSLSRLTPDQRDRVLRRVAALNPDAGGAVEAIGSQGRSIRSADLFPHPPFNPCVRFSRTRLTDDLLDMVTPPLGSGWCHEAGAGRAR